MEDGLEGGWGKRGEGGNNTNVGGGAGGGSTLSGSGVRPFLPGYDILMSLAGNVDIFEFAKSYF